MLYKNKRKSKKGDRMKKLLLLFAALFNSALFAMDNPQAPSHQKWNPRSFRKHTKKSLPLAKEKIFVALFI